MLTQMLQGMGLRAVPVKIQNIVVGDLPGDSRADYYVTFSSAHFPDMSTSVVEQKLPKVVHFPETMILRLRRSALEHKIRITVRQMNKTGLGHTDVAECLIGAEHVYEWGYLKDEQLKATHNFTSMAIVSTDSRSINDIVDPRIKRIVLHPLIEDDTDSPAWISIKFGDPDNDHYKAAEEDLYAGWYSKSTSNIIMDPVTHNSESMKAFKGQYRLLNPDNTPSGEPEESELDGVRRLRKWVDHSVCFCKYFSIILFASMLFTHYYVNSCYSHFELLTQAHKLNETWGNMTNPIPLGELDRIDKYCETLQHSGADMTFAPYCKVTKPEVETVCWQHQFLHGTSKARVHAFTREVTRFMGEDFEKNWGGVPCLAVLCQLKHEWLDHYRVSIWVTVFAFFLLLLWAKKYFLEPCIRRERNESLKRSFVNQSHADAKAHPKETLEQGGYACMVGSCSRPRQ